MSGRDPVSMKTNGYSQWSSFWQQGFITTFGRSKPDNYSGVIRAFWKEKFLELPTGSRILDVATGNGAVATFAASVSTEKDREFSIAATDAAEINPNVKIDDVTKSLREQVIFHSNEPCESQPFDDDSFDFISSQFGFEYGDIDTTMPEMRRILVPGGRFVAISHHIDSRLVKAAKAELEVYRHALDELNIFGTVRKYFGALGEVGSSRKELSKALERAAPLSLKVNDCMNTFREEHPDDECAGEIVAAVGYLARGAAQTAKAERLGAVDAAQVNYRMAQARLKDMVDAALNPQDIDTLTERAKSAGFTSMTCLRLFVEDGSLAGWQIHMQ